MIIDGFAYLIGIYWPYLIAALVIGIVAGWLGASASSDEENNA